MNWAALPSDHPVWHGCHGGKRHGKLGDQTRGTRIRLCCRCVRKPGRSISYRRDLTQYRVYPRALPRLGAGSSGGRETRCTGMPVPYRRGGGPYNVVSPAPVTNAEYAKGLARVLSRPAILPAPAFALQLMLGGNGPAVAHRPTSGSGKTGKRRIPAQVPGVSGCPARKREVNFFEKKR